MINHTIDHLFMFVPGFSSADLDPISGDFLPLLFSIIFMLGCKMSTRCVT